MTTENTYDFVNENSVDVLERFILKGYHVEEYLTNLEKQPRTELRVLSMREAFMFADDKEGLKDAVNNFFQDCFNLTCYDDEVAERLISRYLGVVKAILFKTTAEYIEGPDYDWYINTVNMPFLTNHLEWGCSIRFPWFCCGTGKSGPDVPFELCNNYDTVEITDRETLERFWGATLHIWENFVAPIVGPTKKEPRKLTDGEREIIGRVLDTNEAEDEPYRKAIMVSKQIWKNMSGVDNGEVTVTNQEIDAAKLQLLNALGITKEMIEIYKVENN